MIENKEHKKIDITVNIPDSIDKLSYDIIRKLSIRQGNKNPQNPYDSISIITRLTIPDNIKSIEDGTFRFLKV